MPDGSNQVSTSARSLAALSRRQGADSSSRVSNMRVATRRAAPAANRPCRLVRRTGALALPCPVPRSLRSSLISIAIWTTPPRILRTGSITSSRCSGALFGCSIRTSRARVTSAGYLVGGVSPTRARTIANTSQNDLRCRLQEFLAGSQQQGRIVLAERQAQPSDVITNRCLVWKCRSIDNPPQIRLGLAVLQQRDPVGTK